MTKYFNIVQLTFFFLLFNQITIAQTIDSEYETNFFETNSNDNNTGIGDVFGSQKDDSEFDGDDVAAPIDDYLPLLGIIAVGLAIFYKRRLINYTK